MSVNHFPYLPLVTNPEKIPVSRRWSGSPPKFNHFCRAHDCDRPTYTTLLGL